MPTSKKTTAKSTPKKYPSKAAAAKKSAPPKSAPTPPDDSPSVYSLDELVQSHGPATQDEVFARVSRDRSALIADGAEVATPRIDTDTARLYGRASDFLKSATLVQQRALRGVTGDLMRIAIWSARHGQELHEQRRLADSAGAARQEQRQEQAQALRQQAIALREQLAALLWLAAGGNEQLGSDITRAYGRIATPEELAQSLAEQVKLGQKYLVASDPALRQRTVAAGLDATYLGESAAVADRLRDQLKTATASREAPVVSQADIDLWDGVNLYLLGCIINLFEVGNQLEPTVPRLVPLALRTWFKSAPSKKPTPPAPTPAPSTT